MPYYSLNREHSNYGIVSGVWYGIVSKALRYSMAELRDRTYGALE